MSKDREYRLLDAGDERKLEHIGPYRVTRQAAQAYWPRVLDAGVWDRVEAVHHRATTGGGHWEFKQQLPESWLVDFGGLTFKIKLTGFGHIGLFPEQAENWDWIRRNSDEELHVLNLFGYTGGSSLAAAQGGARVTHVDASKGVVGWARENAAASGLDERPIRWIVEDVGRYIERERKRGTSYQGLILDPPSFGRGPKGQLWKIETHLIPLLEEIKTLMDPLRFVLLSCHTPGYSPCCLMNVLHLVFGLPVAEMNGGEMLVPVENSALTCAGPI